MQKLKIELVGAIGCSGTDEAEKLIKEILNDYNLSDAVLYVRRTVTSIEDLYTTEIYGSPTILIDGKDLIFGDNKPQRSLA